MPSIKGLALTYDALNERATFSEGDTITGTVTLDLEKETSVETLFVKAKGDARVHWSEKRGDRNHSHSQSRRLFKAKAMLIPEDTALPKGVHTYKYNLQIPLGCMPSSFSGLHGKIVYKLECKLSRSWRMDHGVEKELRFVSRAVTDVGHLMSRQVGSTNKEMGLFSKGQVHMDVIVDSRAYAPGQTAVIVATVNNVSSKDMKPKFSLKQKIVYRAHTSKKYSENTICKMAGDVITPSTEKTVKCAMRIPGDVTQTIQNFDLISVEYQLKVYLDISFASDPEVIFPVVILPAGFTSPPQPGGAVGPFPPVAAGGPSSSDFPLPAPSYGPHPALPPGPGAYGYPAASGLSSNSNSVPGYPGQPPAYYPYQPPAQPATYSVQPPAMAGGYYNPMPQQASPYGSPFSSSSSSQVHHPPPPTGPTFPLMPSAPTPPLPPPAPLSNPNPSAPPLFDQTSTAPTFNLPTFGPAMNTNFLSQQDEEPPSYMSLFSPPASEK